MARQKGVIKYDGTIGDIRHFKIKGHEGYFAGLVGGPTANQVKNAPEFVRTRENMNEFGGCAVVGKAVRSALAPLLNQFADAQVTGRLTAIMKKINLEDQTEARGYRAILISTQRQYLKNFNFNKNQSFKSVFSQAITLAHDANRTEGTLEVTAFDPRNMVYPPLGATHFRLILSLSVISDYAFNATTKGYEPIAVAENEQSVAAYSDYLPVDQEITTTTTVTASLAPLTMVSADSSVLQCIGIEFLQKVGTQYANLYAASALNVADIF